MSPTASRRYIVGFVGWTVYETVLLANSKEEAIAKGIALYNTNSLGDFLEREGEQEPWQAHPLDEETPS